ncbi:hypothetical protein BSKO_06503 [Bryopsis sp. KO-2023]|nr:hypothetical protein BSKO_06503 [Bryopsis sp. KO-2023]
MGNGNPVPPGFLGNLSTCQEEALAGFQKALMELHFPASGLGKQHLRIWGVRLDNLDSRKATKSQKVVLLKFLRSRDFAIDGAAAKLMRTLQWRKSFNVDQLGQEKFSKELETLSYNHGRDREGRPVQYNIYSKLDPSTLLGDEKSVEKFIRWRVKFMEETISNMLDFEAGVEDIVHVHDYSGVKLLRMDKEFQSATRRIIRVFGDYYPEMLSVKFFINVPRVVEVLFNFFSMFLHPKTVSKFRLCGQTGIRGALLEKIAPEELPGSYGGFISSKDGWGGVQSFSVGARRKINLTFNMDASQELRWEFVTEFLDVRFTVGPESGGKRVCNRRECGGEKYKAAGNGNVVLTIDNSYSLLTDKVVWIRTGLFDC